MSKVKGLPITKKSFKGQNPITDPHTNFHISLTTEPTQILVQCLFLLQKMNGKSGSSCRHPLSLSEHFLFKLGCSSRIMLNTAFQAASTNQNQHTLKFTFHFCHRHYFIQLDYPMIQQPADQMLKMRSSEELIKAAALTSNGSLQWGRKLNTTCSTQELKNYNSLKPFTTLTNNPTHLNYPWIHL